MLLSMLTRHVPGRVERCLDIGGGGDVAEAHDAIRERFAKELHAVDLGDDVERGRRKGVDARACDLDKERLPYEGAYFDLVLFASVIEHLYNPAHALAEIARVTKPSGIVLIETPNAVAFGRRLDAVWGKNPFGPFNRYNAAANKAVMEHCSVFYTAEEIEGLLVPRFTVLERRYGMHTPQVNPVKALVRETVFRLAPRMADCFAVVARRNAPDPG